VIQPDAVAAIIRNEKGHNQVREMLKPGTSALFMVVEQMTTDKAVDALSKYGGTVLKTSLSDKAEKQLQDALHGEQQSLATQMNRASWPQTVR
jgi:uncharacterized membrane protein